MKPNAGSEFMRLTRYSEMGESLQKQGIVPQPLLELPFPSDGVRIPLVKPVEIRVPHMDLRTAIEQRRTIRTYWDQPLTLEELSYLLWASQGVKHISNRPSTARTVPSAGARHAFETLVLVNRVDGLKPGLYRYLAIEHELLQLTLDAEINSRITKAALEQSQIATSAVTLIWVAVVERMFWRYMERGYRYLHLDAGHACQNLSLAAEQIACGICPIAAFDDELMNTVLSLDGLDQFVVYLASVGKKKD